MATDYLRDGLFLMAWFGLMTCVWFGWAQEKPPHGAAGWLGAGSVIGILAAVGGGLLVWLEWSSPSALEGRYHFFGILVGVEVAAAAVSCLVLARRRRSDQFAVAVGLVVALHFIPLAFLLSDWGLAALGLMQAVAVLVAARVARNRGLTPSYPVGVAMGLTLIASSLISAIRWVPEALAAA